MRNAWRSLGPDAALIIVLTVVVYLPALHGGFVFDDSTLITDNQMVKESDGLHRFWFTTEALDYYPLTMSLWWLEWRLWGNSPAGYHMVNLLLHIVNAILVWMILQRLKIPGAWLAAMVFAIHPVNVATVAWISEGKNTLSMLLYLCTILLYLRFDKEGRQPRTVGRGWRWPRSERGWYGLSLAAFLLALLSKTAVVMLPVVLLGCLWWTRGRVRWKDFLYSGPFFVLSLILGLVTIWFQHNRVLEEQLVRTIGFASRLAAAGWVPWFYLYKALLPIDLIVIYPKWAVDASRWISYVPGTILVGWLIVFWWKRGAWGRPLLFALGYFVVTLFPVLGFFDQGFYRNSLVADHWQYYSIVAPVALAVAAGERICRCFGQQGRSWGTVAGVAVLLALGAATWRRGCVYANDETLWRDTVARNPNAWLAHNNLGVAFGQAGKIEDATGHLEQALRIEPDDAEVHSNLGNVLLQAGKIEDAMGQYEQALRIKPKRAEVRCNLGNALFRAGRVQEAIEHYEQALRINPDYAEAHYNLGVALQQAGRIPEAIGHFEQALKIKPDYTKARNRLVRLGAVQ